MVYTYIWLCKETNQEMAKSNDYQYVQENNNKIFSNKDKYRIENPVDKGNKQNYL